MWCLCFCRKRSRLWASATIATLCLIIPPLWWRMNCGWWWSCSVEVSHLALNRIDFALIFTFTVNRVSSGNIFTFNSSPNFDWMLACSHFSWKRFNIYLVEDCTVFVCINDFTQFSYCQWYVAACRRLKCFFTCRKKSLNAAALLERTTRASVYVVVKQMLLSMG